MSRRGLKPIRSKGQMLHILPFGRKKYKDANFDEKYSRYLASVKEIKSLQKSCATHLDHIRRETASAASLTVQLAHFHKDSEKSRQVLALGQLHAELERVQLSSLEQLYEREVLSAIELVLWKLPDVQENMKYRKKLMSERSSCIKKFENTKQHLEQAKNGVVPKGRLGRRKKTESELGEEMLQRQKKLSEVELELEAVTTWLLQQFEEMTKKRASGSILQTPVAALVACRLHIAGHCSHNLGRIIDLFPGADSLVKELERYDAARIRRLSTEQTEMKRAKDKFGKELCTPTPRVVCDCIGYIRANGLNQEGLFRIPGDSDRVNLIQEQYDLGREGVLDGEKTLEIHDVCTLLKMFFRKLPEPLVPFDKFQEMLTTIKKDMDGANPDTVKSIVYAANHFPKPNRELFGFVMLFLNEISQRADHNKMSAMNLATCWAPSITRPSPDTPIESLVADMHPTISFLRILIENAEQLSFPKDEAIRKNTHVTGVVGSLRAPRIKAPRSSDEDEEFF